MHNKKLKAVGIVVLFVMLGAVYLLWWQQSRESHDIVWIDEVDESKTQKTSGVLGVQDSLADQITQESKSSIFVYVCGYVLKPDVYELEEGSRMFQAIELAGGVLPSGDVRYLNMAGVLSDGERVYVSSCDEVQDITEQYVSQTSDSKDGLININKATKEQLMTLPGIGEAKACAIIQYREQNGGFMVVEDIMNISGIKEAAFSKIKSLICT